MRLIRKIVRKLDSFSEWMGRIFSWIILILVLLSCYEVFTRRILGRPTIWTHEVLSYVFCGTVMLIIGYTQLYKAHVNVDFVYGRLSRKGKAILDLIGFVLFLGPFCYVMLSRGIIFAATSWAMLERTPSAFNFYVFPAKTLIPVGAFLLTVQALSGLLKDLVFLTKGEQL